MVVHRCRCLNVSVHVGDDVRPMVAPQTPGGSSQSSLSSSISSNVTEFVLADDLRSTGVIKNVGKATLGMGGVKKEYEELTSIHQLPNGVRVYRCDNCLTNVMATAESLPAETVMVNMDLIVGSEAHEELLAHEKYSKAFRIILDEADSLSGHEGSYIAPKGLDLLEKRLQTQVADSEALEKRFMQDRIEAYTHNQQILFKKFQINMANQKQLLMQRMTDKNRKKITVGGVSSSASSIVTTTFDKPTAKPTAVNTQLKSENLVAGPLSPFIAASKQLPSTEKPPTAPNTKPPQKPSTAQPSATSSLMKPSTSSLSGSLQSNPKGISSRPKNPENEQSGSVFSFEEDDILEEQMKARGVSSKYSEHDEDDGQDHPTGRGQEPIGGTPSSLGRLNKSASSSTSTPLGSSLPISIPPNAVKNWENEEEEEEEEQGKERLMPHQIAASMYEYSSSFDVSKRRVTFL